MDRATLRTLVHGAAAAALVTSGAALVASQQSPDAAVFTVQQAAAGRAAYAKSCASCHMPDLSGNNEMPPLAGAGFMNTWGTRTTKELFDYMSASMPYGLPALSTETYESIAAFILQINGASAGSQPLSAMTAVPIRSLTASRGATRTGGGDEAPPQ
jgi:mono/diheme cytochrome c family protein